MGKLKLLFGLVFALPLMCINTAWAEEEELSSANPVVVCETWTIVKVKWFPEWALANEIATYVYNTYGLDYLLLLRAENWTFEPMRRHPWWKQYCVKGYNEQTKRRIPWQTADWRCYGEWKTMSDWWLCGFNEYWHPEIVKDPNFSNWQRQADKCVELKKGWTVFYWRNGRYKRKNDFIFTEEVTCH